MPTYMVCGMDALEVLSMNGQFKAAPVTDVNGPFVAGTFGPLKVVVTPKFTNGEFLIGVNGNDLLSSVAIYGVYMPEIKRAA